MKKEVRFLEVYSDIFFVGVNLGKKLPNAKCQDLKIWYDTENDWFEFHYKKRIGYTRQNSAFWEFEEGEKPVEVVNTHKPMDTKKIKGAQVSGPTDHVFQGQGAGLKRQ